MPGHQGPPGCGTLSPGRSFQEGKAGAHSYRACQGVVCGHGSRTPSGATGLGCAGLGRAPWGHWAGVPQRTLAMGSFCGCHPRPGPLLDHELVSFGVQTGTRDPLSLELVSTGRKSGQVFRLEETIWLTFGRCAARGTRDGTGSTVALRAGQRSLWARLSIRVLKE